MNIPEFLKAREWYKMGRWKEPLFLAGAVTHGILDTKFGAAIPFVPSAYIYFNHRQYISAAEYKENINDTIKLFEKKTVEAFRDLRSDVERNNERLHNFSPMVLDEKAIEAYLDMIHHQIRQWYEIMLADGALSSLYPVSLPEKFVLRGEEYNPQSLLTKVSLPKKLFPMIEEHARLLKIASRLRRGEEIEGELGAHAASYSWMNSLCWWDEPFTKEYYRSEAEKLAAGDPEGEFENREAERRARYDAAEELLTELKAKYPEAWQLVDIIRELTDLKEENWDAVSVAGVRMRPLFKKTAAKFYLSYNQLMQLAPSEMLQLFRGNELPVEADILNARLRHHFVANIQGEPETVISGEEAAALDFLLERDPPRLEELKGMPVWQGLVRGRARVLNSADEVGKMEEKEIMICPMSDPDYMPAIKKASAIVADQGGLLCHAAIVARELQIPCVVGTEYATKILKDGDLVEVDANQGIVRKL